MNNNFNEMMADPMTSQKMTVNNRMRTSTRSMSSSEKQKQRPDNNRLSMLAMRSTSIQIARMTIWTPVTIRTLIDHALHHPSHYLESILMKRERAQGTRG
jgi:hypothetical protein